MPIGGDVSDVDKLPGWAKTMNRVLSVALLVAVTLSVYKPRGVSR